MENIVYASNVTEYESGYGQRNEGFLLAINEREYESGTKIVNTGSYDCYSRAGERKLVKVTPEMYMRIKKAGYLWIDDKKESWYVSE